MEQWTDFNIASNFGAMSQFSSGNPFSVADIESTFTVLKKATLVNSDYRVDSVTTSAFVKLSASLQQSDPNDVVQATKQSGIQLPRVFEQFALNRAAEINAGESFVVNIPDSMYVLSLIIVPFFDRFAGISGSPSPPSSLGYQTPLPRFKAFPTRRSFLLTSPSYQHWPLSLC